MSVLIDTSIWSLALRRKNPKYSAAERLLIEALQALILGRQARLIGPIRQQLLTGLRHSEQLRRISDVLRGFEDEPLDTDDYEIAADIANACIRKGIAVSDVDLLLCSVCIRRGWQLFTTDKDFLQFQRVCDLKLYTPQGADL